MKLGSGRIVQVPFNGPTGMGLYRMADWAPLLLQGATAAAAAWAAVRVRRLRRGLPEPRLSRLEAFFWLFAAATALHLAGNLLLDAALAQGPLDRSGFDGLDVLFWLHHAGLVAALLLAASAYRTRAGAEAAAVAPLLLWAEPLLRLVETGLLLWLLWQTLQNHRHRRNVGSLQVAVGFLLLAGAHAGLLAVAAPLGWRPWWVELLALSGTVLLGLAVPRRT